MEYDWLPGDRTRDLRVRIAYSDDRIFFRFAWDQPHPGGWLHDMLVYRDSTWQSLADPQPWAAAGDRGHEGFYEDRLSFFLDDGSVRGFTEFGGWLTVHEGLRTLPSAVDAETVQAHDHYGRTGLDKTDLRKYLPQACAGAWWENDWRAVRDPAELAALKADGVFLDLPMWRAHRSDPLGYGTDHHVLEYRHDDQGQKAYTSQAWDAESGPSLMFDPAVVSDGALDLAAIRDGRYPEQGVDPYALYEERAVPFDPAVAEWEGALIPRRLLQPPSGSAADWLASGTWADGEWVLEMSRRLRTAHPADTTQLADGGVYSWSPAVHAGAGQRWHWVAYPYRLGLGVEPSYPSAAAGDRASLVATPVQDTPEWRAIPEVTIPMVFPGVQTWGDLTSSHPRADAIRDTAVTMWDLGGVPDPWET